MKFIVACVFFCNLSDSMARESSDALELSHRFNGVFSELPRDNPRGSAFCSLPFLGTSCGQRLYVVSTPPEVVGGTRRGCSETLCALLLDEADSYPNEDCQ